MSLLTPRNEFHWQTSITVIRCGYSLLELMIALTLLSGLLAAGWSMLATYRDAEQRGWRLVERTQTIRAAQLWLQNDLIHIAAPKATVSAQSTAVMRLSRATTPTSNSAGDWRSEAQVAETQLLVGSWRGFRASINASIDPLPFFERMLAGQSDGSQAEMVSVSPSLPPSRVPLNPSNTRAGGDNWPDPPINRPLWPMKNMQVQYELLQSSEALVGNQFVPVYDLIRRESVDREQLQLTQQDPRWSTEPILSIDDLYRQNNASNLTNQAVLRENYLPGLINAEFWYCDGAQWIRAWNSSGSDLPTAVALVFDFAPNEKKKLKRTTVADFSGSPVDMLSRSDSLSQNLPTIDEPLLQSSIDSFELIERDVRLIVLLEQSWQSAMTSKTGTSPSQFNDAGGLP